MVKVKGSFMGVRQVSACKKEAGLGVYPKVPQVIGYEIVGNTDLIGEKKSSHIEFPRDEQGLPAARKRNSKSPGLGAVW